MILAPLLFFVTFLGWHDTPSYNDEYFIAHLQDESVVRVPSNYFLSASVTYSQGRIAPSKPGHFPTGPLGVLYSVNNSEKLWHEVQRCNVLARGGQLHSLPAIVNRVRAHHRHILNLVDDRGFIDYDFFPHHIWSMPWEFKKFRHVDKRNIVAYSHVIESKCLDQNSQYTLGESKLVSSTINRIELN